jgi:hypothetical protein
MQRIVIGADPHKLSATIEVVDHHEVVLTFGRFATDRASYAAEVDLSFQMPDDAALKLNE